MKLKTWAREQGISYRTALNWFHAGNLPVPARQLPTGTILVGDAPSHRDGETVAYCHMPHPGNRGTLRQQAERLVTECSELGIPIDRTVVDDTDGPRTKLLGLLAEPSVSKIVVDHHAHIASDGGSLVRAALSATGRQILTIDSIRKGRT